MACLEGVSSFPMDSFGTRAILPDPRTRFVQGKAQFSDGCAWHSSLRLIPASLSEGCLPVTKNPFYSETAAAAPCHTQGLAARESLSE